MCLWINEQIPLSVTFCPPSATINGSLFRNITQIDGVRPHSMVYDWRGGNIFLTEKDGYQIRQLAINGEGMGVMLEELHQPGDLVIDVHKR